MFRNVMMAVVTWVAFSGTAAAQQVLTPEQAIPDQYIVVFDDAQTARTQVAAQAQALARQHGGRILHVYEAGVRGFAASMSATAAAAIARNPRVRYVEQDSVMTIVASQPNATWGLDRIDQRSLPLNTTYTYDTSAVNVDVYIIDTGIRSTHVEFGGRVTQRLYGDRRRQRHERLQRSRHARRRHGRRLDLRRGQVRGAAPRARARLQWIRADLGRHRRRQLGDGEPCRRRPWRT